MAVLPNGLSNLIEVGIRHSPGGNLAQDWYTTYQFSKTGDDFTSAQVETIVKGLIAAEKVFHYSVVSFHGGYGRRYVAKTTEPNPDPWTYNPTNHVPIAWSATGVMSAVGLEIVPGDIVLDMVRAGSFGNPGRIEFRGVLAQSEVIETLSARTLDDIGGYMDLFGDFFSAIEGMLATMGGILVLVGEPRISIVRTVVDNVLKTLKLYGPTFVRQILSVAVGSVRQDKNNIRWHNNPS